MKFKIKNVWPLKYPINEIYDKNVWSMKCPINEMSYISMKCPYINEISYILMKFPIY